MAVGTSLAMVPNDPSSSSGDCTNEESLEQLKLAAGFVDQRLGLDERRADTLNQLVSRHSGSYTFGKESLKQSRFVAIPRAILDQYDHLECKSFVGLFPEVSRAYITIDNRIFLWNYHDGADFHMIDELDQIVVSIALVKPKPGIFKPVIKYLLAVATPVEIVLFGISFAVEGDVHSQISVHPTHYRVPSDNVQMLRMLGTESGRIFMCGQDGNVYELDYQARDGWLTKKCRKLNHSQGPLRQMLAFTVPVPAFILGSFGGKSDPVVDLVHNESRQTLFALHESNTIQAFVVSSNNLQHVSRLSNVRQQAIKKFPRGRIRDDLMHRDFSIVKIEPVPRHHSEVCLVAVTNHGHRIFLRFANNKRLFVQLVRICPPYIDQPPLQDKHRRHWEPTFIGSSSPVQIGLGQAMARFNAGAGLVVMADAREAAQDTLVFYSTEDSAQQQTSGGRPELHEAVSSFPLPGRVLGLAEVPQDQQMTLTAASLLTTLPDQPALKLSEAATQHAVPPRSFLALTSIGLYRFDQERAIDRFCSLLVNASRAPSQATGALAKLQTAIVDEYGAVESLAMCLMLSCNTGADKQLRNKTNANAASSMAASSQSSFMLPPSSAAGVAPDAEVEQLATQAFFGYGGSPTSVLPGQQQRQQQQDGHRVLDSQGVRFSPKCDALWLFLTRLLRPVWKNGKVVVSRPKPASNGKRSANGSAKQRKSTPESLKLRLSQESLVCLQQPLLKLHRWCQKHRDQLMPPRNFSLYGQQPNQAEFASLERARIAENNSIANALHLLDRAVEAFYLLIVLASQAQHFDDIVRQLPEVQRKKLCKLDFPDLLTRVEGQQLARLLIQALVTVSPAQKQWVDQLHRDCPHFFGNSDKHLVRATQHIEDAKMRFNNDREREASVKLAVESYCDAAASAAANFPLHSICAQLHSVHAYEAIVIVCLRRAQIIQKARGRHGQLQSLTTINGGMQPLNNSLNASSLNHSFGAQGQVTSHNALNSSFSASRSPDQWRTEHDTCFDCVLQMLDSLFQNQPAAQDAIPITIEHKHKLRRQMVRQALRSDDEEFHVALYEWFIAHGHMDHLYALKSRFLEQFLVAQGERTVAFLKDFYLRNNIKDKAARLLSNMATNPTPQTPRSLTDRMEFLSRALICAKESGGSSDVAGGDLVFELQDRMRIAEIQLSILNRMSDVLDATPQDAANFAELKHAVNELDSALFDINDLFAFATSASLSEQRLQIIHFCNARDEAPTVRAIWDHVVREAIRVAQSSGNGLSVDFAGPNAPLRKRLVDLGQRYKGEEDFMFPLDFLLSKLEDYNFEYRPEPRADFVVPCMLAIGVDPFDLLEKYKNIVKSLTTLDDPQRFFLALESVLQVLQHVRNQSTGSREDALYRQHQMRLGREMIDFVLSETRVGDHHLADTFRDLSRCWQ